MTQEESVIRKWRLANRVWVVAGWSSVAMFVAAMSLTWVVLEMLASSPIHTLHPRYGTYTILNYARLTATALWWTLLFAAVVFRIARRVIARKDAFKAAEQETEAVIPREGQ